MRGLSRVLLTSVLVSAALVWARPAAEAGVGVWMAGLDGSPWSRADPSQNFTVSVHWYISPAPAPAPVPLEITVPATVGLLPLGGQAATDCTATATLITCLSVESVEYTFDFQPLSDPYHAYFTAIADPEGTIDPTPGTASLIVRGPVAGTGTDKGTFAYTGGSAASVGGTGAGFRQVGCAEEYTSLLPCVSRGFTGSATFYEPSTGELVTSRSTSRTFV